MMEQPIKIVHFNNLLRSMRLTSGRFSSISNTKKESFQLFVFFFSLFTLDKNQCRGVDLQQQLPITNPYEEQPGIALKGDNLARMLALRSGATMQNVERLADDMIMYGLVRFGKDKDR